MDDSIALVEGVPDGMLLSEWSAQNDVGRTTTYALLKVLKAMGIPVRWSGERELPNQASS
jgi:hypothetical protein